MVVLGLLNRGSLDVGGHLIGTGCRILGQELLDAAGLCALAANSVWVQN